MRDLRVYVSALNDDCWAALADPEDCEKLQPMDEPELPALQARSQMYEAWVETPGALECLWGLFGSWDAEGVAAVAAAVEAAWWRSMALDVN